MQEEFLHFLLRDETQLSGSLGRACSGGEGPPAALPVPAGSSGWGWLQQDVAAVEGWWPHFPPGEAGDGSMRDPAACVAPWGEAQLWVSCWEVSLIPASSGKDSPTAQITCWCSQGIASQGGSFSQGGHARGGQAD